MTDWHLLVTKTFSPTMTTVPDVTLLDHCVTTHCIPLYVLTGSELQLTKTFLGFHRAFLDLKLVVTTAFYLQTNGHTKQYNPTFVERMRNFVNKHKNRLGRFCSPVQVCLSCRVRRTLVTTPCSLVSGRKASGPVDVSASGATGEFDTDTLTPQQMKVKLLHWPGLLTAETHAKEKAP